MIMRFNHFSFALFAALALFSCSKRERADMQYTGPSEGYVFSVAEESPDMVTKSVLGNDVLAGKRSGVSVGLYVGGRLVEAKHSASFSGISFTDLGLGQTCLLYAMANMGDQTAAFPETDDALPDLVYIIPSYTEGSYSVNSLGIPMAGSLEYKVGIDTDTTIPVRRLLSQVNVTMTCNWPGAQIKSAKVCNMNARLSPFGSSKADAATDILAAQEIVNCTGAGTNTLSGTFYVPENMQGSISRIADSSGKSPDGNNTVNARQSLLTYIETHVVGSDDISGHIDYRCFLGNNATTNFDIERNCVYNWTLTFTEDGLTLSDWKHDNNLSWTVNRYALSPASMSLHIGDAATFQVLHYTDVYEHGVKTATGTEAEILPLSALSYVSQNPSVASVAASGSDAVRVNALSQGSTDVRVTVNGDGAMLILPVAVSDVYTLTISPLSATLMVGSTKSFTATLKKNGVEISGSLSWSSSNPSVATIDNTGTISGRATGSVTITVSYTPAWQAPISASANVTVVPDGSGVETGWDEGKELDL